MTIQHTGVAAIVGISLAALIACQPAPSSQSIAASQPGVSPLTKPLYQLQSDKPMGLTLQGELATFRVFAPNATQVSLVLFQNHQDKSGNDIPMQRDEDGVWEVVMNHPLDAWKFYGYRLDGPKTTANSYDPKLVVADPYSPAVVRLNHYTYPTKSIILDDKPYDWGSDTWIQRSWEDYIIQEAHLKDLTADNTSNCQAPGTYQGVTEENQQGGIHFIESLGYNAVEFLPLQEFGFLEVDYKNPDAPVFNDWNPYARNHWGYMTSFFFAPSSRYASDGSEINGEYTGTTGKAVTEMKDMVKAFHKKGIAVILDVVYNHVSQYDANPLKYIDKQYYFRLDEKGEFLSKSGCGNDLRTESPMARRLIVESILYWMQEYHIDGFRFDLAAMIDMETVREITKAARLVNPDVILIGEPWGGGGYNPRELAEAGWASWNDDFRNAIKGRNPNPANHDTGFIFGNLWDKHTLKYYQSLMSGYTQDQGGHYVKPNQSVNYLESHDDNTMGDFIRLGLGNVGIDEMVQRQAVAELSRQQIQMQKLAAVALLTSQGPVMIHEGQTWGRAKVIASTPADDPHAGQLDHNSYNKDNETNWLNWNEASVNHELVDYYRGLIAIRSAIAPLRNATKGVRQFLPTGNDLSLAFMIPDENKKASVVVVLNGNTDQTAKIKLPEGKWLIVANEKRATLQGLGTASSESISVPAQSGQVLIRQ
ncbi:MAG: pullulanase [Candidatus Marinimicrobia bacterium CG_4_10_14_0_2_um_filter_48_9]|nr:MAG: pullulanase [Candidatus Marinimicrobia bacterium CG_4_10_14_0_2_um_filter_48_9]